MEPQLDDEITQFLRSINSTNQDGATNQDEMETVDVYFVRREAGIVPESDIVGDIVDAAPVTPTGGPSAVFTTATIFFSVGILFSAIALQLYLATNPPIATVTIVPKTQ